MVPTPLILFGSSPTCTSTPLKFNAGRVRFSEGTSAKWIFDVGIENSELKFCLHVEKTKIMLDVDKFFSIDRLRPTFYNFIFTFPELAFHDF